METDQKIQTPDAKMKKRWYDRWWAWIYILIAVIVVILLVLLLRGEVYHCHYAWSEYHCHGLFQPPHVH